MAADEPLAETAKLEADLGRMENGSPQGHEHRGVAGAREADEPSERVERAVRVARSGLRALGLGALHHGPEPTVMDEQADSNGRPEGLLREEERPSFAADRCRCVPAREPGAERGVVFVHKKEPRSSQRAGEGESAWEPGRRRCACALPIELRPKRAAGLEPATSGSEGTPACAAGR